MPELSQQAKKVEAQVKRQIMQDMSRNISIFYEGGQLSPASEPMIIVWTSTVSGNQQFEMLCFPPKDWDQPKINKYMENFLLLLTATPGQPNPVFESFDVFHPNKKPDQKPRSKFKRFLNLFK